MPIDYDMEQARELYFSAGGPPSQIDRSNDIQWYLRRAAILWKDKAESKQRKFHRKGQERMRERSATVVDDANRAGPYNAIAAAEAIRSLPIKDGE